MATIQEIAPAPWRIALLPASFNGVPYHVEQQSRAGGRRIVLHEYPKRDKPYAEDMGRQATRYSVTGYLVGKSYNITKLALIAVLERSTAGLLIDPYLVMPLLCVCERYGVTETRERGGYCVFETVFAEAGLPGNTNAAGDSASDVASKADSAGNTAATSTDDAAAAAEATVCGCPYMIAKPVLNEALHLIDVALDALLTGMPTSGRPGFDLRHAIGKMRADAPASILAGTVGSDLYACFEQAQVSGATVQQMDNVREALLAELPVYALGTSIKSSGIVFTLVEQARNIVAMTFTSRQDVERVLGHMLDVTEEIKLEVSELLYGTNYQAVVALSASLMQHLAAAERQLPRIVSYHLAANLPSLTVSNFLYGEGSRADELAMENKTVHPAFMQRDLMALSQ